MSVDIYAKTTDIFKAEIEKAIADGKQLPWEQPWNNLGAHTNFNSKRPYRGFINQMMLELAGFTQPLWATYKGWREAAYREWAKANKVKLEDADISSARGGKGVSKTTSVNKWLKTEKCGVKKGEKGTWVVFWAIIPNKKYDKDNSDSGPKSFFMLRYYNVFNIEQTEGITIPKDERAEREFKPIEAAEKIWNEWEDAPPIAINGNSAHYNFLTDEIGMPDKKLFKTDEGYYATLFHEGVHATGHDSRLKRPLQGQMNRESYSKEELIAEMGSAMLRAMCGIETEQTTKNTITYLRGWLKALNDDPKMVIGASTKAAAACDYILGVKYDDKDKDDG